VVVPDTTLSWRAAPDPSRNRRRRRLLSECDAQGSTSAAGVSPLLVGELPRQAGSFARSTAIDRAAVEPSGSTPTSAGDRERLSTPSWSAGIVRKIADRWNRWPRRSGRAGRDRARCARRSANRTDPPSTTLTFEVGDGNQTRRRTGGGRRSPRTSTRCTRSERRTVFCSSRRGLDGCRWLDGISGIHQQPPAVLGTLGRCAGEVSQFTGISRPRQSWLETDPSLRERAQMLRSSRTDSNRCSNNDERLGRSLGSNWNFVDSQVSSTNKDAGARAGCSPKSSASSPQRRGMFVHETLLSRLANRASSRYRSSALS